MKSVSRKVTLSLMLVFALLAASIIGCPAQDTETTDAPTIPPENTFIIDFSDFTSGNQAASATLDTGTSVQLAGFTFGDDDLYSSGQYALGDKSNWVFATGSVVIWSAVVVGTLAVPVKAFVESFKHTPQQQPDYSWIWPYDVPGTLYSAELHGEFIDDYNGTDDGVRWEMYISKQGAGGYDDFEWFYGESDLPATEGFWMLKRSQDNPVDFVNIIWERDLGAGTYSITYTNVDSNDDGYEGYITHGVTTDETYNCFYEIYNAVLNRHTTIEWNSETLAGRVKAEHQYGNNGWHAWDADRNNIAEDSA